MEGSKQTAEEKAREDLRQLADVIEYLDTQDIGDELEAMPEVHFEIHMLPRRKFYPLDAQLSEELRNIAGKRGISAETLLNQWVREKAIEILTVGAAE